MALAPPLRWRPDAARLTDEQAAALRAGYRGMSELTDERGYWFFAGLHGLPLPIECIHGEGRPFLPWHRAFLYFFERALIDRSPGATLPWWNWATPSGQAGAVPDLYGAPRVDGADNPLFSMPVNPEALASAQKARIPSLGSVTVRDPGGGGRTLPTKEEVDELVEIRDFTTFSDGLEELHGQVHMWTGGRFGHMRSVPWAAFDPIFWAHHCMVDRIWRLWQVRHNAVGPSEDQWSLALPPFPLTVGQTLDVTRLGFDYASSTSFQSLEA